MGRKPDPVYEVIIRGFLNTLGDELPIEVEGKSPAALAQGLKSAIKRLGFEERARVSVSGFRL